MCRSEIVFRLGCTILVQKQPRKIITTIVIDWIIGCVNWLSPLKEWIIIISVGTVTVTIIVR